METRHLKARQQLGREAYELHQQGLPLWQIGNRMRRHPQSIARYMKDAGYPRSEMPRSSELIASRRREHVKSLASDGVGRERIAKIVGVPMHTIRNDLRLLGIEA